MAGHSKWLEVNYQLRSVNESPRGQGFPQIVLLPYVTAISLGYTGCQKVPESAGGGEKIYPQLFLGYVGIFD